jgi:hypothetical protein
VTARPISEQARTEILQNAAAGKGSIASHKAEKSARRRIECGVTTDDILWAYGRGCPV